MNIHQTLKSRIPEAMKARDEVLPRTLRSLVALMTNEVVAKKRKPDEFLTDEEALTVLKRAANMRKDSITQFEGGGRPELAVPEKEELAVIEAMLPAQMSEHEIKVVILAKITELGVCERKDIGKLLGAAMKEINGRADGAVVKAVAESVLQ